MKKLLFIISIGLLISCSKEEETTTPDCNCTGQFINIHTEEYIYQETDCDRTPPSEDYVFVKCVDNPDY